MLSVTSAICIKKRNVFRKFNAKTGEFPALDFAFVRNHVSDLLSYITVLEGHFDVGMSHSVNSVGVKTCGRMV